MYGGLYDGIVSIAALVVSQSISTDLSESRPEYLFPDVHVGAAKKLLDLRGQIARHFSRGNVAQSAQRKSNDIHVGVVQIANWRRKQRRGSVIRRGNEGCRSSLFLDCICFFGSLLLERVGQEGQDLLVLVQKQHGSKIAQSLVRE